MFAAFMTGAKPFDLAATLESWSTANADHLIPEFRGKPKRKDDPTAQAWLDLVEMGCGARRVPKTHWPDVAKHFMAKKARGRVMEVEKVMRVLQGEQWGWTWKSFRVAFLNMGWNIDEKQTREVNVERKTTGLWRIVAGNKDESSSTSVLGARSSGSKAVVPASKTVVDTKPSKSSPSKLLSSVPKPAVLQKEKDKKDKEPKPTHSRSNTLFSLPALPFLRAAPQPEQSMLNKVSAQVPLWLLAATEALAGLANDNPDVLTAIATVLVAVGTISGGGTAAVAAIGEAAVVVGRALKSAHDRVNSGGGHGHHGH
ncbi:hypothetical protein BD309DRAFT_298367 [Dichomitus squalens]|uniref:Uncharacterized protein n=1 Tax=Dichomitus squalens TaxID=114155 RepID=A0A4Q9NKQ3_9APHY|nr:hypothetical protein BD309DRAFT_298367 [Dichomitus squalens]TBU55713.1 hypothetical protein BD310DRAFT_673480 [Dichomitus squalens]